MKSLIENIPEYISKLIKAKGISVEEIVLVAKGDMTIKGEYGESWVLATSINLIRITGIVTEEAKNSIAVKLTKDKKDKGNWQEESYETFSIKDIDKLSTEQLTTGGILVATIGEEDNILCRYSASCSRDFGVFAKGFSKLKEGKDINEEELRKDSIEVFCPKCGTRYQDLVRKICPKCFDKRSIFKRVLSYTPRYKWNIALILLCMLASSMLNIALPYVGGNVFYDKVLKLGGSSYGQIGKFVLLMLTVKLLSTLISIAYGRINSSFTAKLIFDLKTEIFEALQKLSLSFYNNKQTGALMNNVNGDAMQLQNFFHDGAPYFIVNVITMTGIFGVMLSLNWKLTLIAIFPMPIIVYILKRLFPRMWKMFSRNFRQRSALNSIINDSLTGARVVKAFGKERTEVKRFSKINDGVYDINVDLGKLQQTAFPLIYLFMGSSGIIIWGYGSWLVVNGDLTFGTLITFTGYVSMLMGPLQFMSQVTQWWSNCMNSASRIFEIIDTVPEVQEKMNSVSLKDMKGEVELKDVTFSYEPNNNVLHNINLQIKPGEMIGLVGHSGAGKSTLINIITRLYDVKEGEVLIDGINVKDMNMKDLHSQVGIVLQDTYLFMGSIAENIAYARPASTMKDIINAAKIANAHDFIMKLSDGYDTIIGSKGQSLSGGEKQRIAIARAVLLNPKILILDEATASLDTETERMIQEALERLVKGRTTIAIAHRLSTLRNADRLVVVEKGSIKELGTHEELIKVKGIYYKLLQKQKEALKLQGVS
jgi:ATP-binding cassette subfamily B protein